ncbi:MAG: creatininase family protein [Thermoanaerobaculia bacterium]
MHWQELNSPQSEQRVASGRTIAILPLGAIEAHGPHLPLGTDVWIAEAMAKSAAALLEKSGCSVVLLPALAYAPAPFANLHAGTLSIRPETLTALVVDLGMACGLRGIELLALANAHFDPVQLGAIHAAADRLRESGAVRVAYPDLTRRRLAERLGEEFRSGACHAGRYETSILLAERPDLVDDRARRELPAVPISLVDAMREGHATFGAAGMDRAYCGDPASATASEGRTLIAELGAILAEAVRSELG